MGIRTSSHEASVMTTDSKQQLRLANVSKVFRHLGDFDWSDLEIADYKPSDDTWRGVTRRVFIGETGESPDFHLRYFEIEPGGYTTLEEHQHEHCVVCIRGRGQAVVGCRTLDLGFGDVLYVAPSDPHQLRNDEGQEPFGFFCVVNAERDRPRLTDQSFCPICE